MPKSAIEPSCHMRQLAACYSQKADDCCATWPYLKFQGRHEAVASSSKQCFWVGVAPGLGGRQSLLSHALHARRHSPSSADLSQQRVPIKKRILRRLTGTHCTGVNVELSVSTTHHACRFKQTSKLGQCLQGVAAHSSRMPPMAHGLLQARTTRQNVT